MDNDGMPWKDIEEKAKGLWQSVKGWVGMSPGVADYTWITPEADANIPQESEEYGRDAFTEGDYSTPEVAAYNWVAPEVDTNSLQGAPEFGRDAFTEGVNSTPGLWGYGSDRSPVILDYGWDALKESVKNVLKNKLGFGEGVAVVLSNERPIDRGVMPEYTMPPEYQQWRDQGGVKLLRDTSEELRALKEAEVLQEDNSLEKPTTALGKAAYGAVGIIPQVADMWLSSAVGGGIIPKIGGVLAGTTALGTQIAGSDYNHLTSMLSKEEADQKGWTREMLRERGIDYDQLPDQKISPERALAAGLIDAAIEAPLEQFAFRKLLGILKSTKPVRNALEGSASETAVEFMQQFPQDAAEIWAKTPGRTWDERVDNFKRNIDDTIKAGTEAAAAAGLFSLLAGVAGVAGNKMGRHTAQRDPLPGQTEISSHNWSVLEKTDVRPQDEARGNETTSQAGEGLAEGEVVSGIPQQDVELPIVAEGQQKVLEDGAQQATEKADAQSTPLEDVQAAKGTEAKEQAAAGQLSEGESSTANKQVTDASGKWQISQQAEPLTVPQQASMRKSLASAVQSGDYATAATIAGEMGMAMGKKAKRYADLARQSDGMTPFGVVERPRGVSAGRLAAREANAKEAGAAEWGTRRIVQQIEPLSVEQQKSMRKSLKSAVQSGDYATAATIARQLEMGKKAEYYARLAQRMTPLESYRQASNGDSTAVAARFRAGEYGGRQGAGGVQAAGQVVNGPARGLALRLPVEYPARGMEGTGPKAIVRDQAQYIGREAPVANHPLYKGNKETLDVAERDVVPVEYAGGIGGRLAEGREKTKNGVVGRVGKVGSEGAGRTIEYSRPSGFRKGVREKVWENAKGTDGKVRDPLTGGEMKFKEPWDMGHRPGLEFRKHQQSAQERKITRREFLDEHNNPEHYQPEMPSSNRCHKNENKTDHYFGP
jgi:hypothetical protein